MHHKAHKQMSEAFLTAAFLSVSGGLQDAYTYLARGNVFANAQTGNIVLLSQHIADGDLASTIHYLIPLSFFALGVAAAEIIHQCYRQAQRIHWRQLVLVIEILLLFAVGFLPDSWNLIANSMVSFSCAMQVQAFRKVNSYAFASTMCIGNLRQRHGIPVRLFPDPQQRCPDKINALFWCYFTVCFRCRNWRTSDSTPWHAHDLAVLCTPPRQLPAHVYQRRDRGTSGNQTLSIRYPIPICVCI